MKAFKGLLAKVYLTKSGINADGNGQRDADDLAKAASYAKDVINNSGKQLMANYEDIFKALHGKFRGQTVSTSIIILFGSPTPAE